jgi:hypothetical protein
MSVTGAIIAGVGAAASIGGAAIASHGAGQAAQTQAAAADRAAQLSHEDSQAALEFQKQQYADQVKRQQPWIDSGNAALGRINSDMANGTYHDWTGHFTAPDAITEQNDPGFQQRLKLGQEAIDKSAAARGGLLTGGTARAQQQFGQDFASNEYSNVYNRAFGQYQQGYNEFNNNQATRFNRDAALSGVGQTSVAQVGQSGQAASTNINNILSNDARNQSEQINNAAAARASGYTASANAWSGAINQTGNTAQQLLWMNYLG